MKQSRRALITGAAALAAYAALPKRDADAATVVTRGAASAHGYGFAGGGKPTLGTTWNPTSAYSSYLAFSNGNKTVTRSGSAGFYSAPAVNSFSDKRYFEATVTATNAGNVFGFLIGSQLANGGQVGTNNNGVGYAYNGILIYGGLSRATLINWAAGDVIMLAADAANQIIYCGRNGTWLAGANPAGNSGGYAIPGSALAAPWYPACSPYTSTDTLTLATALKYPVPSGFKAGA